MPIKPSILHDKVFPTLVARLERERPLSLPDRAVLAHMMQACRFLHEETGEALAATIIDEVLYAGKKRPTPQSVNTVFQIFKADVNGLFVNARANIMCRSRKAKASEHGRLLFFEKTDTRYFKRDYRVTPVRHVLSSDEILQAFVYGLLRSKPKKTASLRAVARHLFTIAAVLDDSGQTTVGAFYQGYASAANPEDRQPNYLLASYSHLINSFFSAARLDVRLVVDPTAQAKGLRPLYLFGALPQAAPHKLVGQATTPTHPAQAPEAARQLLRLYEKTGAFL